MPSPCPVEGNGILPCVCLDLGKRQNKPVCVCVVVVGARIPVCVLPTKEWSYLIFFKKPDGPAGLNAADFIPHFIHGKRQPEREAGTWATRLWL